VGGGAGGGDGGRDGGDGGGDAGGAQAQSRWKKLLLTPAHA